MFFITARVHRSVLAYRELCSRIQRSTPQKVGEEGYAPESRKFARHAAVRHAPAETHAVVDLRRDPDICVHEN